MSGVKVDKGVLLMAVDNFRSVPNPVDHTKLSVKVKLVLLICLCSLMVRYAASVF